MYFIIWRGWGILVIPLAIIGAIPGLAVAVGFKALNIPDTWIIPIASLVATLGSFAAIWYTAKGLSSGPTRRLVDPQTGEQFVIRRDAGSLFFIPMRFWAYMVLTVGLLFSAFMLVGGLAASGQATKSHDNTTQSDASQSL